MERPIWWAFGIILAAAIAGVIAWLIVLKPFDKLTGELLGFWMYVIWDVFILMLAYWLYVGF